MAAERSVVLTALLALAGGCGALDEPPAAGERVVSRAEFDGPVASPTRDTTQAPVSEAQGPVMPPAEPQDEWSDDEVFWEESLSVTNGSFGGAMGDHSADQWDVTFQFGYRWENGLDVTLEGQTEEGFGMTMISFYGLDLSEPLQPGLVLKSAPADSWDGSVPEVSGMGCSGDDPYAWEFDEPAEEVTVELVEADDPSLVTALFEARLSGGQTVSGQFTIPRSP